MVLKKKYLNEESSIATYDYQDIAEGTGIVNFYGFQAQASGAAIVGGLTSDNTLYSNVIAQKVDVGSAAWGLKDTTDYDVIFNLPKQIKGQARLTITQGAHTAGAVSSEVSIVAELYRNGDLMATGGTAITHDDADALNSETKTLPFDLSSQVWNFKAGDILRLRIKLYGQGGADAVVIGYGIDPQDRDDVTDAPLPFIIIDTVDTTQLKLSIPFILDV